MTTARDGWVNVLRSCRPVPPLATALPRSQSCLQWRRHPLCAHRTLSLINPLSLGMMTLSSLSFPVAPPTRLLRSPNLLPRRGGYPSAPSRHLCLPPRTYSGKSLVCLLKEINQVDSSPLLSLPPLRLRSFSLKPLTSPSKSYLSFPSPSSLPLWPPLPLPMPTTAARPQPSHTPRPSTLFHLALVDLLSQTIQASAGRRCSKRPASRSSGRASSKRDARMALLRRQSLERLGF